MCFLIAINVNIVVKEVLVSMSENHNLGLIEVTIVLSLVLSLFGSFPLCTRQGSHHTRPGL